MRVMLLQACAELAYYTCLELARIFRHQAETGKLEFGPELDRLFQLHGLLAATLAGKLAPDEWDLKPFKKLRAKLLRRWRRAA